MDKNSNVVTQYIICECGDNFPNEALLNIHLANGHGSVEVFKCDACSSCFPTKPLLDEHSCNHGKAKKPPPKTLFIKPKDEKKKPPVIKLRNLKRIDSISLIQSLKSYSGLIKLEPASVVQEAEYQLEMEEQPSQVLVKSEVQEPEVVNEEIYYQCDVCNTIFYTESDFNLHYQSTHAMKVEPTPEEILEDHLVTDHINNANVKAEVEAVDTETAYYYECEIKKEPTHTETRSDDMDLLTERKRRGKFGGRPKKPLRGRRPIIDVYADMPPGLSAREIDRLAQARRVANRKEQLRQAYRRANMKRKLARKGIKVEKRRVKAVQRWQKEREPLRKLPKRMCRKRCIDSDEHGDASNEDGDDFNENRDDSDEHGNEVKRGPGDSAEAESSEKDPLGMELKKDDAIIPENELKIEIDIEINRNENDVMPGASSAKADAVTEDPVLKKKGAKKKESKTRKNYSKPKKPQIDVYADMPEGISEEEVKKIAEERLKEIKREKWRQYAKRYRERNPEKSRQSAAKYAHSHPEVRRRASAKYAKSHPEVGRNSSAKYAKSHPEVGRNSSAKYAEKKKNEKLLGNVKTDENNGDDNSGEMYQDCIINEYLCIEGENIDGGTT